MLILTLLSGVISSNAVSGGILLPIQMNRFLKTFLIWLLIAVLPLHAVATTMSTSCGPIHHKAMQVVMLDHAHQHDSVATQSHHHGEAEAISSSADMSAADDIASETPNTHRHATCSGCTATCVGAAAPPSASNAIPAISGSEMVFVSPAPLVAGFIPGGLERPPRNIFA
ncbi:MAG: hypothetical protein JWQ23_3619 [Herminiimonas sp.]|nr:hypothetical protein [Herminiimonas sp.]